MAAEVQLMDSFSPRKYLKYTSTDIEIGGTLIQNVVKK